MDRTIRRATADDISGIQRVVANSWRDAYDGLISEEQLVELTDRPAEFYPEERFQRKLNDEELLFFVALAGDEVAGLINFCWGEDNTHEFVESDGCQIRSLYLDPRFWREGIGTSLFETGREAIPGEIDELFVEVLSANERGRAFYESIGFTQIDHRTVTLYGEPLETQLYRRET
ncbi:GNAT family N-acetyltransferase [Natronobacterium gregoryi]|uniref:Acetyltransferase n=2 Tax=Natronobacterium gregoryi TaxID=44930 RepID=L0AP50_NATGS|nr:GNAT family N-acetyltransferase [Natronobacterium gregoryi]AFZ74880.1 acetyltransferase [Natronobacterium gregoryi SP2]PLK19299.1 N-acetyltransferase [Natronobacterium gregoryi SP2]SFJ53154.1 Ribosomal protein S18 acetylase RimI [Natronobacterium gregoryi]